ncbi:glycosyltransferase family 2 protein [Tsuneonella sp. HG222]
MQSPRVSVVCIFLDQEAFLGEAIDSVLGQEFHDFELLLMDDGSSDRSTRIAQDAARMDPARVRYLEHPGHANRGMSAARNLGLANARGEFVTFLDGDDRFRPGKLGEQVALLDAHPEAGMICGGYNRWREWDGGFDEIHLSGPGNGLSFPPETTLSVYPLGWSKNPTETMIRRSIAQEIGGYEDTFRGLYEDQAFYSKAFLATGVLFTDSVWLDYRAHARSNTAQIQWHEFVATRQRFLDWFEAYLQPRDVVGKSAILARLQAERRATSGLLRPWLRSTVLRAWLKVKRAAGSHDLYRRHSHGT